MMDEQEPRRHKYRWKMSVALLSFSSLLLVGPPFALVVGMFVFLLRTVLVLDIEFLSATTAFMLGVVIVLLSAVFLVYVVNLLARCLSSYLIVSPEGLNYRYGFAHRLKCTWDDVERIGERKRRSIFFISSDILFLKNAEILGWPLVAEISRKLSPGGEPVMYLGRFQGWPDGGLGDDLRHYAPHLFDGDVTGMEK